MKIYILTDYPYHDNEMYFGAYSSEEKAREALASFAVDPNNGLAPSRIVAVEIDVPAHIEAADLIEAGENP